MCGISGILNHPQAQLKVEQMIQAQTHRGPDAQGVFVNETKTAALGHNRT
jgi:asparagine synthetase B (glutamine-hydrolysing)